MATLQDQVADMYQYMRENLYLCRPDLAVTDAQGHERRYNAALLFGTLTALTGGKQLLQGEVGLGKTTSAENIISLMYSIPRDVVVSASLSGHPEQTEEKTVGRLDFGKLSQGSEEEIWSYFVTLNPKVVDEVNRLPPGKQNLLLQGIDRGVWKYMNGHVLNRDYCIFGTMNYQDAGNTEIIPPLVDRFDISVESKHMGINNARVLRDGGLHDVLARPEMDSLAEQTYAILDDKRMSPKEKWERITDLGGEFRAALKGDLELLSPEQRIQARAEIAGIPLVREGDTEMGTSFFLDLIESELATCQQYGQKRTNQECPPDCHWKNYLCHGARNGLSTRTEGQALPRYAKALAWFLGDDRVTEQHVKAVLPYTIWHKLLWKDEHFSTVSREDQRDEPWELHLAQRAADQLFQRFTDQKNRMALAYNALHSYAELMGQGKGEEAEQQWRIAQDLATRGSPKYDDHPVFAEYVRG